MVDLKLNTGGTVLLFLKKRDEDNDDDKIYDLVDETDVAQMVLRLDNYQFVVVDKKNVIENDSVIKQRLKKLYARFEEDEKIGIEDDDSDEVADPFNPEEISIDTKGMPMETFLRRLTQGTIDLNPDFQRKEVWNPQKKSQLIESLMLKIPIPMFYVSADEKSNLTVVDGLQRLSTIRDFVFGEKFMKTQEPKEKGNGFRLQNLEFWKIYENKNFNELPTHIKNRILETEFTFTIINPSTPEEVRRNIFKRINTGGSPLSSQEIRNALYVGNSTKLLNELAGLEIFEKATDYSIKDQRMEDKELILRFLSFVVRDYKSYIKTVSVDTWLSDTMVILNSLPNLNTRELNKVIAAGSVNKDTIKEISLVEITNKFEIAMKRSYQLFGKHAFRKSYPGKRRTPINKSLFEIWGVLLSGLSDSEFANLVKNKNNFMKDYIPHLSDYDFIIAISRDSMKHLSVKYRFNLLSNIVEKYI